MYKNNSGLVAKTKVSKFKKRSVFSRKVSASKTSTILILDRCVTFEKELLWE